jgi:hypothetical protein
MVEQQGFGRTHGNKNPKWKIRTKRNFNRKLLGKAKQKSIITGRKGMAARDGGSETNLSHKIEPGLKQS